MRRRQLQHLPLRARARIRSSATPTRSSARSSTSCCSSTRAANGVDAREQRRGRARRVRRRRPPDTVHARDADGERAARAPALPRRCQRPRHLPRQQAQAQAARTRCTSRRRSSAISRGVDAPPRRRRRQHHRRALRARLDVADPAARRRDERRRGVLPRIPQAAPRRQRRLPDADAASRAVGVGAHAAGASASRRCTSPATTPTPARA